MVCAVSGILTAENRSNASSQLNLLTITVRTHRRNDNVIHALARKKPTDTKTPVRAVAAVLLKVAISGEYLEVVQVLSTHGGLLRADRACIVL